MLGEPVRFRGKEQLCNLRSDLSYLLLSKTSVKVPVEQVMFVCAGAKFHEPVAVSFNATW